jgi:integrase
MQYWHDGQRFRESTYCERPKEADRILRSRLLELDRLNPSPRSAARHSSPGHSFPGRLLVSDLYASMEQDYMRNTRDIKNLQCRWKKHLQIPFATMPVASVTTEHVGDYIAKRLGEKAKNATINRELAALKRMYKLAIKTGRLKLGEQPYFSMLKEKNVRKGFVKDAQYAKLARSTGEIGLWLRTLFELGFVYGWRKSELLGLQVSQIDMIERTIVLEMGETKNDDGRVVEMTGIVYELLGSLVAGKGKDDFVFTRNLKRGHTKPVKGFRKAWAKATAAAGCPTLLFHDLRRSGVRNLVRAGIREKQAMEITGHKTRAVFERYNISDPDDMHRAIGLVEKAQAVRRQKGLFEQADLAFEDPEEASAPRKPTARVVQDPIAARKIQ